MDPTAAALSNFTHALVAVTPGSNVLSGNAKVQGALHVNNYGSSSGDALLVTGGIVASADVVVYGTVSQSSDLALKADLARIRGARERLCALSGYTFRMLRDGPAGPRRMGLVAQEVARVAPEAVSTCPDGTLSVAYGGLLGLVVEAVKDLSVVVDRLELGHEPSAEP